MENCASIIEPAGEAPDQTAPAGIPGPYLVFLGGAIDAPYRKTALGLRDWAADRCVGEWSLDDSSIGLKRLTPSEAMLRGARSMVIGVANVGGEIRDEWVTAIIDAMEAGLHIVSGMHGRIGQHQAISAASTRYGRRLIDLRVPPAALPIATGRKRSGKRLLTIGTDCALGKKYAALAIAREMRARGIDADFRATGQTGILIAGQGIPIDAVVADFIAGAAETLSPAAAPDHWDIIEGQGSLFHPSYAGVSLGLMHGSQPDRLVLCHAVGRARILGLDNFTLPSLAETISLAERLARLTNPAARCCAVSLNTAALDPAAAAAEIERVRDETGLPAADPMRGGSAFQLLVDKCLEETA